MFLNVDHIIIQYQKQNLKEHKDDLGGFTLGHCCYDSAWFSVGAPTMTQAMSVHTSASLAFIISFYTFLVGSKIVLAIFVGKSKSFLSGNVYIYTMRFLGLVLCVFAIVLFYDGLKLVGNNIRV